MAMFGILSKPLVQRKRDLFGMVRHFVFGIVLTGLGFVANAQSRTVEEIVELWKEYPGDMSLLALLPLTENEEAYALFVETAKKYERSPDLESATVQKLVDACHSSCELELYNLNGTLLLVDHKSETVIEID